MSVDCRWLMTLLCFAASTLFAQTAEDWVNKGVQAFKSAQYAEAVAAFQNAVRLKPTDVTAHLYLGTAWMSQYIPGADTPENLAAVAGATAEFQTVLQLDPKNSVALQSLASLVYFEAGGIQDPAGKQAKLDEAQSWYERLLVVDPKVKEAHYSLGVIAWTKWYPAWSEARVKIGMKPEDPGPLRDSAVRADPSARFESMLGEAIAHLEKALEIDPEYFDAMAYLNLLFRERADLRDTPEEYSRDVAKADEWLQKALDTRKRQAHGLLTSSQGGVPGAGGGGGHHVGPRRIHVAGNVQEAKLVKRVDPECPADDGGVQEIVRLGITVDTSGSVTEITEISGKASLVALAKDAVRQWKFQPTLLNGEPVEVGTSIAVSVCASGR
ncbi:MAG TPA: tetratricopeptide repeat protein [Bryobacteraceae bacterium]|nr:tetratricopeptide repeat protein [Bryobacteraceae bacterium]